MGAPESSLASGGLTALSDEELIRRFCANRERLTELEKTPESTRTDPTRYEIAKRCAINEQLGTELWNRHKETVYKKARGKALNGRRCPRSYTRDEFADESFSLAAVNFLARICGFEFRGPIDRWLKKLASSAVYDTWRSIEQVRGSKKSIVLKRIERCLPEPKLRDILEAYIASESLSKAQSERAATLHQIDAIQKVKQRHRMLAVLMLDIMPEERVSELLEKQEKEESANFKKKRPKAPAERPSVVSVEDLQTEIPDRRNLEDSSRRVTTIDLEKRLKDYAEASDANAESIRVINNWREGLIPREIAERDYGLSMEDRDARVQRVRRKIEDDVRGLQTFKSSKGGRCR